MVSVKCLPIGVKIPMENGMKHGSKCDLCSVAGSKSAILLHKRLKHGAVLQSQSAVQSVLQLESCKAPEITTPETVEQPEELAQLMATARRQCHEVDHGVESGSDDGFVGYHCASNGHQASCLIEFPMAVEESEDTNSKLLPLVTIAVDYHYVNLSECDMGSLHVSSQVASKPPAQLVDRGFGENSGPDHQECTADFDGLLDALGLAQTSAPQLLATLISSALAKDDWEHIIDREFYMTSEPVYSKALTLLGWKE